MTFKFERQLILPYSAWDSFFEQRRIRTAAMLSITVGFFLALVSLQNSYRNDDLVNSAPTILILLTLILLLFGFLTRRYVSIPTSIIIFDLNYLAWNIIQVFYFQSPLTKMDIAYSVLYFVINSILFRLKIALFLNLTILLMIVGCMTKSISEAGWGNLDPELPMVFALSLGVLVLQHLVLAVRGLSLEQLSQARMQMAKLETEIALESARDQAKEQIRRLNRFSVIEALGASIAHEVNQPIAAALVYAQAARRWLTAEAPGAAETQLALEGAADNLERAGKLISDIRLLTTNKGRTYSATDINELIRDQINLIAPEFVRSGVALSFRPAALTGKVVVCASEIALAVINLLRNALEACAGLSTSKAVEVWIDVQEPGWLEICVSDTGRGLPENGIDFVFAAFQSTKLDGAGIGLSICQEVAEHHAGSVTLRANPDAGVTAVLRIVDGLRAS